MDYIIYIIQFIFILAADRYGFSFQFLLSKNVAKFSKTLLIWSNINYKYKISKKIPIFLSLKQQNLSGKKPLLGDWWTECFTSRSFPAIEIPMPEWAPNQHALSKLYFHCEYFYLNQWKLSLSGNRKLEKRKVKRLLHVILILVVWFVSWIILVMMFFLSALSNKFTDMQL